MSTTIIFECGGCDRQENRPEGFGMPIGWDKRGDLTLCDDCLRGSAAAEAEPPAPIAAVGGTPVRPDAKDAQTSIMLRSGVYVDLADPDCSRVHIMDIAHGLSMTCRFAGQLDRFYSVAEHSVLVSHLVEPELAWDALMHDSAEAIIGDVTSPLKRLLPDYRAIEEKVEASLAERFLFRRKDPAVKRADLLALAAENKKVRSLSAARNRLIDKAAERIAFLDVAQARNAFLLRAVDIAPFALFTGRKEAA